MTLSELLCKVGISNAATCLLITGHYDATQTCFLIYYYKKAVLPQGNRAMPQVFFSVEVRQQHSLQV